MSYKKEALEALGVYKRNMQKILGESNECIKAIDTCIRLVNEVEDNKELKTFMVIDTTTGKEADPYEIALHEEWAKNLMYCDMEGFAIEEDGTLILLDECGRHNYCPLERFEVVWDE